MAGGNPPQAVAGPTSPRVGAGMLAGVDGETVRRRRAHRHRRPRRHTPQTGGPPRRRRSLEQGQVHGGVVEVQRDEATRGACRPPCTGGGCREGGGGVGGRSRRPTRGEAEDAGGVAVGRTYPTAQSSKRPRWRRGGEGSKPRGEARPHVKHVRARARRESVERGAAPRGSERRLGRRHTRTAERRRL